jgi:hypothetical protein
MAAVYAAEHAECAASCPKQTMGIAIVIYETARTPAL